ncbi:MAG TPA: hypothetical protein VFY17_02330, partial [Pilimelia sp.]|nr:hypothetical protein [Pilimelia sp.]
ATLRRDHVRVAGGAVRFCYLAKGGVERTLRVADEDVRAVVRGLLRRADDSVELLAYRRGRHWCDVRSTDVNAYLRQVSGMEITAKDFRTWNGTVLAAVTLGLAELDAAARADRRRAAGRRDAAAGRPSATARRRVVSRTMREVAAYLGNTPGVARTSYVDPRVVDLFGDGVTIAPTLRAVGGAPPAATDAAAREAVEAAVREMLATGGEPAAA